MNTVAPQLSRHVPILLEPIVRALIEPVTGAEARFKEGWIVDATFGGGGHSGELLKRLEGTPGVRVLGCDQDQGAIERGRARFAAEIGAGRLELWRGRFGDLQDVLAGRPVVGLLADLGFSSDQIDDPERGLSFRGDGPLDMRLDPDQGESCASLLGRIAEKDLADLIFELGEERYSRRIAWAIVEARSQKNLPTTTGALAALIQRAVPPAYRHGRIHPATRTFQALRIAVNDELGELDRLLAHGILAIKPGGRVAILSFHSLEDRKVKQALRTDAWEPLTKKPQVADDAEIHANPRSRSAKLRIAERQP